MLTGDIAKQFTTCAKRDCNKPLWPDNMFFSEMAVRFLSCNNPMPVEMDPLCFMKHNSFENDPSRIEQADDIPFVLYELCEICNKSTEPHPAACYPDQSSEQSMQFGYPCVSGTKMKTYCAGDYSCVATYKDSPDSYEKRPLMTCDK
uniref:Chitin-binding type-2 domain-containing protein n=1 Tax=Romanomermis culicivorax TaxID=13658 RepID=A0A915J6K5_ROMCU